MFISTVIESQYVIYLSIHTLNKNILNEWSSELFV